MDRSEVKICSFYNPPKGSEYRYNITDLLKNILKSKPALICCDLNFPDAHWKTASSSNEEENEIIEIFDEALFRQAIDFPTCSNNTLDLAFYQNCFLFAEKDQSFPRTYNWTDHDAIHLSINCPVTEPKPVLQPFRSFGNADYDGMNKFLKHNPFQLICHKNVNTMCEEVLPICRPSGWDICTSKNQTSPKPPSMNLGIYVKSYEKTENAEKAPWKETNELSENSSHEAGELGNRVSQGRQERLPGECNVHKKHRRYIKISEKSQ